jgi:hypothetical protein
MLGFAGWVGAFFLFGFVAVSLRFILENRTASLLAGAAACAAAAFIFRALRGKEFAVQFGLAVSFAGQGLFISGLTDIFREEIGLGCLAIMVFEAVLVAAVSNQIHRVVSSCASAISLSFALSAYDIPHLAPPLITAGFAALWLKELNWADRGLLVRPVGYGFVVAAICVNGILLMGEPLWSGVFEQSSPVFGRLSWWSGVILNSAVFIFTVSRLLRREGLGMNDRTTQVSLVAAVAIAISSFKAPGITTGLIIVLLGYANANRLLTGLGILGLIGYLSLYYYQLETTLLVKSAVLAATGIVLLIARFVLSRVWPANGQGGDGYA